MTVSSIISNNRKCFKGGKRERTIKKKRSRKKAIDEFLDIHSRKLIFYSNYGGNVGKAICKWNFYVGLVIIVNEMGLFSMIYCSSAFFFYAREPVIVISI